ncbi:uncharacterized protein BKA55DRAFT_539148 [Fusarium redolens]|uniref:Uncharacterized protein n=1 Tax=Fusarium redolens TaxID=48865 RepID=A0A9P9HBP4_FUSRE|nr:uncharacterized protein BKA55DRAFT_539148 [Fusarium redolens]KAH7254316.1 hypothetical protein BKA55DRAFT_539148 [Fusarium redolens]
MRSAIHLRLAYGLLAIGSAVASPCKPPTTTSAATPGAATETSLVTSVASTTEDVSATSSAVVESSVETSVSSAETTASSTEAADSSITIETSATSAAETTSTAPIPTFTMFASGSNAVAGRSLQSYGRDNAVVVFDPATDEDNPSVRQYSIDSQGRLVNDLGWFLCGYYSVTNEEVNKPATVVTCHSETPSQTAFLFDHLVILGRLEAAIHLLIMNV